MSIVTLWDATSGAQLRNFENASYGIDSMAFSPDGSMLAGASGLEVILWDVASGRKLRTLNVSQRSATQSVTFSPDGRILALAGINRVRLWDVASREELRVLNAQSVYTIDPDIGFSPDSRILATVSGGPEGINSEIILWDIASGKQLSVLGDNPDYLIKSLAFSPDGKLIASGSPNGIIRLWGIRAF